MNRRNFFKSIFFIFASFPLKIFPSIKQRTISFDYGVASGDPTHTNVILWTKISTTDTGNVNVLWEVSTDNNFLEIINSGQTEATSTNNFTIKVDAEIPKEYNGKRLFYRFISEGIKSDIGNTLTLPKYNPDQFNIAFCSCSNYPAGYFNAYQDMANNEEIDLVLHLGDYIYEYSREGYASKDAEKMGRLVNPANEIISLDDYRKRHATYKSDKDLQLLHKSKPMIVIWDDHEIANDTWKNGAQNHTSDEGSFKKRRDDAVRAYYEWMPIRETQERKKIWRNFSIGNLINLVMLDTRLVGRDKQIDLNSYFEDELFNKYQYEEDLNKPRKLLGDEQLKWIDETIDSKYKWSIFGQQLLIGPKNVPSAFRELKDESIPVYFKKYLQLAGEGIPINTDQWDGYPMERQDFYKVIAKSQSNLVLAGDSHNSWFSNLIDDNDKFIGIEIGAPAISSPSTVDSFGDFVDQIDKSFVDDNKDLVWTNGRGKGYVLLNISETFVDVNFHYVSTVKSKEYRPLKPVNFRVEHNKPYTA